jgi:hypothetical protein
MTWGRGWGVVRRGGMGETVRVADRMLGLVSTFLHKSDMCGMTQLGTSIRRHDSSKRTAISSCLSTSLPFKPHSSPQQRILLCVELDNVM